MTISRKPRRALLVGVALALVVGNVWWFTRPAPTPVADFELGRVALDEVDIPPADVARLPRFDAGTGTWRIGGRPIDQLGARVVPVPAGATNPDHVRHFLAVDLAASASSEDMRRMLLSLAQAGICAVAVHQDGDPASANGDYSVPVHRIVSVRADDGARIACEERS